MKNVLIVKPSSLGDIIQATCILPVLRAGFPGIRITWLVFQHNAEVLAHHPLIERVLVMRRNAHRLKQLPKLVRELRTANFDAVIDIQGLLRSAVLSRLTGCSRRIGYANGREQSPWFYTETHDIPTRAMHAVDGYLRLCERLGASLPDQVTFPLPLADAHRHFVEHLIADFVGADPLVTLCPTARWSSKCWPEAHYAALADLLGESLKAKVIWLGAPREVEMVGRVASQMRHPCLDLSGRLTIMQLAALLERSDLFVGNDSGLTHLAAATKTRTLALFGPTDPLRTGPYNPLATVVRSSLQCMPCFKRECRSLACLTQITPESVAGACRDRLHCGAQPAGQQGVKQFSA
jgi:heptosyltransferase I